MVCRTATMSWAAKACPEKWAGSLIKPHMVLGQPWTVLTGITARTMQGSMEGMKNPIERQVIMVLYLLFLFLCLSWLPFSKRCDWQVHCSFPAALSRTVKLWKKLQREWWNKYLSIWSTTALTGQLLLSRLPFVLLATNLKGASWKLKAAERHFAQLGRSPWQTQAQRNQIAWPAQNPGWHKSCMASWAPLTPLLWSFSIHTTASTGWEQEHHRVPVFRSKPPSTFVYQRN